MRILHLLSQLEVTGAETYALELTERQLQDGHEVHIVSDTLHFPTRGDYTPRPIADRRLLQRVRNYYWLKNFLREHKIEVIHAHSRAASWLAYYATKGTTLPVISTIHGRQHIHSSSVGKDIYGDKIVVVCANLKTHLAQELLIDERKISVIPNSFNFKQLDSAKAHPKEPGRFYLSIIGRTSSLKGERTAMLIREVIPILLERYPQLVVEIVGGEITNLPPRAIEDMRALNRRHRGRILCYGFVSDVPKYIRESDLVIAAGRIAVKALYLEVPLLAFGESQYCGLVTPENLRECMASNFGDSHPYKDLPRYDTQQLLSDICRVIEERTPRVSLKEPVRATYASKVVAEKIFDAYRSAILQRRHPEPIPVLMYHKVPAAPIDSRHKIWVLRERFREHLELFRSLGLTTITFRDYDDFRRGLRPMEEFPARPIILTFDDCYRDNQENALPLLKEFNAKAVFYALGDRRLDHNRWDSEAGEPAMPLMDNAALKALADSGMEIGAHGMSHRDLTTIPIEEAAEEIAFSKRELETVLGRPLVSFAYPFGKCSPSLKEAVKHAGFRYAVATDRGAGHPEHDAFEIFRANIFPDDSDRKLKRKTSHWYRDYFHASRRR